MARVTLEPVGRFAFLVVGLHAAIAVGLWWWLYHRNPDLQGSEHQNLTWVSPADFTQATDTTPTSQRPAAPPETSTPAETVKTTPPVASTPAPESPATAETPARPTVAAEPTAVVKSEPPEDNVPKAIALDPAQAAAIMARAQAAAVPPAPPPESQAPPPSPAPVVAKTEPPKPEPKSTSKKNQAKPLVAEAPEPPKTAAPAPAPARQLNDVSRFVTVSHTPPEKVNKGLPKVTSLYEVAALDAASTGATGAATGIRLDDVDRAVIQGFLREWIAPDATKLSLDQRTVGLNVQIARDGRVLNFSLPRRSGSDDLDLSVLEAADRLGKIDATLPTSYPRETYEFQVNFHVE